jgi:exodeoxyribonuclease VII small subunit
LAKNESNADAAQGPTFEQALDQLQDVVRVLEDGEIGLNDSLEQYERGVGLLRRCYDLLHRAERRIDLLSGVDAEGNPIVTPMDDSSASPTDRPSGRAHRAARPHDPPERGAHRPERTDVDESEGLI